jgi:hypothetical protein
MLMFFLNQQQRFRQELQSTLRYDYELFHHKYVHTAKGRVADLRARKAGNIFTFFLDHVEMNTISRDFTLSSVRRFLRSIITWFAYMNTDVMLHSVHVAMDTL